MTVASLPDLSGLSISQLNDLQNKISAEIKHRSATQKKEVLSKIKALAAENGFSLEELVAQKVGGTKSGGSARTVAPKYRHPQDARVTWTGRGKKPRWVTDALAAGKTLEDFLIAP